MIYILLIMLVIAYIASMLFMAQSFDHFTRLFERHWMDVAELSRQLREIEWKIDYIERCCDDTSEAVEDLLSDQFEMFEMIEGYIEKGGARNESN